MGRKPDGKPIRKTIYAKTIKELDTRAAEYERQLKHGTLSSDEKITFGKLAEIWLKDYKPKVGEGTRKRYRSIVETHLAELGAFKLKDLKAHNLQAIINRLAEKGYAEKTLKEIKIVAAQIIEIAISNDIVFRNVFSKVEIPIIQAQERRALRQEEIDLLTSTHKGHRMGVPALLMLYCGIRRGELLALTWGDVSLKDKALTVNKSTCFLGNQANVKAPKTKAGIRVVPIPDLLIPILKAKRGSSMMVCPSAAGEMMSLEAFQRAWESYLHYLNLEAGGSDKKRGKNDANGKHTFILAVRVIENITPHMLRHTYATMLYDAGVDVKSAQRFLGHANLQTTLKIYTHLSEKKEQLAVDALNTHLSKKNDNVKSLIKN